MLTNPGDGRFDVGNVQCKMSGPRIERGRRWPTPGPRTRVFEKFDAMPGYFHDRQPDLGTLRASHICKEVSPHLSGPDQAGAQPIHPEP